ncbi:hypothetical protein EVB41_056 [Rhizobium phage RHph_TM3_14A]|nr:hypothetical protein EVB29_056 [Rhizobium phage RHph_TM27A]QIG66976.1 hypothetical protein EVB30_056 [Rhizobium phage RHph_TM27B]QIG67065.1 hypothetical protein EVB31_055 [Rhizobium phage RHph_TM29]QIG67521.1 hypothetical protein EVB41_056 [Rhizobium phage RHph_TM3_14A]
MPTPIFRPEPRSKKASHSNLAMNSVREMLKRIQPDDNTISYEELVSTVWDEKTIADVKHMSSLVISTIDDALQMDVGLHAFEHPAITEPKSLVFRYKVQPPMGHDKLWPKQWRFSFSAQSPRVEEVCHIALTNAVNRGLLHRVTLWLASNCNTHEQAAWLFPSWSTILRRSEDDEMKRIGVVVSDCPAPRVLPPLPPHIRQWLRYLHTFMAAHELLGTFDKSGARNTTGSDLCKVTLAGSQELEYMMGDVEVQLPLR